MTEQHEHKWVYAGIVFDYGMKMPGSGALYRKYHEHFFCEKCLEKKYIQLPNEGDNSYNAPRYNAAPKS